MSIPDYLPYRSAAAREAFFAYYDALAAKQWPAASETRRVPTSYGETFVRLTGPAGAPPLVLLPGAATTSIMWTPNIQALSEGCRAFAVDQLGDVGRTTCTKRVEHVSDLLLWLDELFDGLKLADRIHLAGISYGGWLAAEYARHAPRRLSTLVLLAPGNTVLRVSAQFIVRIALAAVAPETFLRPLARWMFRDQVEQHPGWLDPWLELALISMRTTQRRLPMPRVWTDAEWRELSVPALFLVGEHETIYDAGEAVARLNRVAPQVTTEV
ncbi:MAG TPA: alpha/beta hydrolase, partial [Terriglobia bacterium]|nr:alpha/beta hydrolase [Terriglobia bacterium]